jgi:hypothetical protein
LLHLRRVGKRKSQIVMEKIQYCLPTKKRWAGLMALMYKFSQINPAHPTSCVGWARENPKSLWKIQYCLPTKKRWAGLMALMYKFSQINPAHPTSCVGWARENPKSLWKIQYCLPTKKRWAGLMALMYKFSQINPAHPTNYWNYWKFSGFLTGVSKSCSICVGWARENPKSSWKIQYCLPTKKRWAGLMALMYKFSQINPAHPTSCVGWARENPKSSWKKSNIACPPKNGGQDSWL